MKLKAKGKALVSLSFSFLSTTPKPPSPTWAFLGFSPVSTTTSLDIKIKDKPSSNSEPNRNRNKKDSILEMFRLRQLQGSSRISQTKPIPSPPSSCSAASDTKEKEVTSFKELGLSMEVIEAVGGMNVFVPSEIQCVGIPALLDGKSVVLSSHPRSGRTLAYLLPLIQLLRRDTKPKHPRAVVLCPTEELSDQVFHVAKFISHYAQQQSATESDLPQKNLSNVPIGMRVGTPGEVLQHIEEGNVVPDEIKYLVLDEADTIFACGLGPEIQKIISPLKIHASKSNDQVFQTVLVTSTIAKILGEQLTPFMERLECKHAGQIAAMLLEMDKTEIFHLTESPDALKKKVAEAMDSFK